MHWSFSSIDRILIIALVLTLSIFKSIFELIRPLILKLLPSRAALQISMRPVNALFCTSSCFLFSLSLLSAVRHISFVNEQQQQADDSTRSPSNVSHSLSLCLCLQPHDVWSLCIPQCHWRGWLMFGAAADVCRCLFVSVPDTFPLVHTSITDWLDHVVCHLSQWPAACMDLSLLFKNPDLSHMTVLLNRRQILLHPRVKPLTDLASCIHWCIVAIIA